MKYLRALCLILFFFTSIAFTVDKPNIIVILADDLGYADVGFHDFHEKDITTPNLDRLAKSGVVFQNAYAGSPICSGSRLALSTGRYHARWGSYYYGEGGLPKREQTIAEILRDAGYDTMKVGKTHLNGGPKQHPMKHGFNNWLGFIHHSHDFHLLSLKDVNAYNKKKAGSGNQRMSPIGPLLRNNDQKVSYENTSTTEVFAEEAVKYVKSKHEKPFYLQLEFNAVHTIMIRPPTEALAKKYGIPMRSFNREDKVWKYPLWDPIKQGSYKKWYSNVAHIGILDPYGRKLYLAYLEQMDAAIGKVMDALKEKGIAENTMIFFSSDNGGSHQSYANNGHLNVYKYCLMDGGIKVPMLLSWPKKFGHMKLNALVSHRDLFATIADELKLKPKNPLDGKNLIPLIEGKVDKLHTKPMFWDIKRSFAVREGKWKLVKSGVGKTTYTSYKTDENGLVIEKIPHEVELGLKLYDLDADPGERKNLVKQFPEKAATLKKAYDEWRSKMTDPIKIKKPK